MKTIDSVVDLLIDLEEMIEHGETMYVTFRLVHLEPLSDCGQMYIAPVTNIYERLPPFRIVGEYLKSHPETLKTFSESKGNGVIIYCSYEVMTEQDHQKIDQEFRQPNNEMLWSKCVIGDLYEVINGGMDQQWTS